MKVADIASLKAHCAKMSEEAKDLFSGLSLHFLICPPEKKRDELAALMSKINGHPAANEAYLIVRPWAMTSGVSSFLGLARGQEGIVFSFKTRTKILAFIAVDTSLYEELDDALSAVHGLMAQFFETISLHLKDYAPANGSILQPKRNQVAQCRSNLKTDIYSTLQMNRGGVYDAPMRMAKQRTIETLTPQSRHHPEEHPFPIALDIVNYAIENQISSSVSARGTSQLLSQYQLAGQIASCFEAENLHSWILFANSSQHMAWSGFTASQILGAAVNTSTNPFIKSIGHMLAELTNLSPVEEEHLPQGYNPFVAEEINQIRHERAVEETFEMVLIHAMEAESHLPIIRVANLQNEGLLKGKITGWCANALQASAKAYTGARDRGIPAIQAARLEFQSAKSQANWKSLLHLGHHVVSLYRKGEAVTLAELANWSQHVPDARFLFDSVSLTIADPKYAHALAAAVDMPKLAPEPSLKFAPLTPVQHVTKDPRYQPAVAAAPSLSLGGGGGAGLAAASSFLLEGDDDDSSHKKGR